ncbi:hypothetical protein KM043_009068 [Ampulex compressa]|nr:hypothetical protein KM043_009068 [Ampulex compressa]
MPFEAGVVLLHLNPRYLPASAKDHDACLWFHPEENRHREAACHFKEAEHRLACFGDLEEKWKSGGKNVRSLVLCDWSRETFDPKSIPRIFPLLRKLSIVNGNLTKLSSPFPSEARSLEKVNVTGTKLRLLPRDAFANLPNIRTLDLRNNSLRDIEVPTLNAPSLHHVYLSGNPLKCTESVAWILDPERGSFASKVTDREKLLCGPPYDGRALVAVVEIMKALKEECARTVCECELVYVLGRPGNQIQRQLMAFVSVNCSHRGLTEMPDFLPANTTTLRLTGNKIEDLKPLTSTPVYKSVIDLYLDDNSIESIDQLEGSYWLDHFRLIDLRGNRLTNLPTYALENVLLHSGHAASLYLGNNPWRCDCLFTPSFQDLLIRYTALVKDINDVRCARVENDENSEKQIRDLTRTEICISPEEDPWLHPLDVLNIILASLIFLVLGKLLYDYWCFKKTGKLPWIVAKIP